MTTTLTAQPTLPTITVEDVEGLRSLPVGTRLLDFMGDAAIITTQDDGGRFAWACIGGVERDVNPDVSYPLHWLATDPMVVEDPEPLLEPFAFQVGDKVRLLENDYGSIEAGFKDSPKHAAGTEHVITGTQRCVADGTPLYEIDDLLFWGREIEAVDPRQIATYEELENLYVGAQVRDAIGDVSTLTADGWQFAGLAVERDFIWLPATLLDPVPAVDEEPEPLDFEEEYHFEDEAVEPETPVLAEGTELVLVNAAGMSAMPGSRAVVTKDFFSHEAFVEVDWTEPIYHREGLSQGDGGYFADRFGIVEPEAEVVEPARELQVGDRVRLVGENYYGGTWTDAGVIGTVTGHYAASGRVKVHTGAIYQGEWAEQELGYAPSMLELVLAAEDVAETPAFILDAAGMEALPIGSVTKGTITGDLRVRTERGYLNLNMVWDSSATEFKPDGFIGAVSRQGEPQEVLFINDAA